MFRRALLPLAGLACAFCFFLGKYQERVHAQNQAGVQQPGQPGKRVDLETAFMDLIDEVIQAVDDSNDLSAQDKKSAKDSLEAARTSLKDSMGRYKAAKQSNMENLTRIKNQPRMDLRNRHLPPAAAAGAKPANAAKPAAAGSPVAAQPATTGSATATAAPTTAPAPASEQAFNIERTAATSEASSVAEPAAPVQQP